MRLPRRAFLRTAMSAFPFAAGISHAARLRKNWAWIPTDTKASQDVWKRRCALMRQSGVSAILPEVYNGRSAYFASTRLPVQTDWLGSLLPLARAEGLEVHAWMWCMPCMIPDILNKHADWYNVNAIGESAADKPAYVPYYKFLDPGRPEVREFVAGTVKELAAIPELTGVHLDYIRHPDAILPKGLWKKYDIVQDKVYPPYDYGYSRYERAQFQHKYGVDPLQRKNRELDDEWFQFRLDMVTGLVKDYLVPAARSKGKVISAAVFPGPTLARAMVRQDWGRWNLDAFLPMLYHGFYETGPEWVGDQTREAVSTVKSPVYSGVFVSNLSEGTFTRTVHEALNAGASGVSVFSSGAMDQAKWNALRSASDRGP